jgi:hypothetical protein
VYEPLDPPVTPGHHYFTLDELREEREVSDTASDAVIERQRDLAEQVIEHGTGIAFIPRVRTDRVMSETTGLLRLSARFPRQILSVTDEGVAWANERIADALSIENRYVLGFGWGRRIVITYEHGMEEPPERIRRAAMIATSTWVNTGPIDTRATQVPTEAGGAINLATPGLLGFNTGIPEVDTAIKYYRGPVRLA